MNARPAKRLAYDNEETFFTLRRNQVLMLSILLNHRTYTILSPTLRTLSDMDIMTKPAVLYARSATQITQANPKIAVCRSWATSNRYTALADYSELASGLAAQLPEFELAVKHAHHEHSVLICHSRTDVARDAKLYVRRFNDCARQRIANVFCS